MANNLLLMGTSGSGKTYLAREKAKGHKCLFIPMNENSSYESLIEGMGLDSNGGRLTFSQKKRELLLFIDEAAANRPEEYFVILDDLNRVDVVSVLGELCTGIKSRNSTVTLKSGRAYSVPDNVSFIGTYNISDIHSFGVTDAENIFSEVYRIECSADGFKDVLMNATKGALIDVDSSQVNNIVNAISEEYKRYITEYCVFKKEYRSRKSEFCIGYSYFLPPDGIPISRWFEVVNHKIKHQVMPLLFQYNLDGIINGEDIPKTYVNDTFFSLSEYKKEKIKIHNLAEYLRYEENTFDKGLPLPIGKKSERNASISVSWQYVIISRVLRELISSSFIDHHVLIELLTTDPEILTFRNDLTAPNGQKGGCLLVDERYADCFPTNDSAAGNKGSYSYSENYHKFSFEGHTYRMFSAYQVTRKVKCPHDISKCIETSPGSQKRHLYPTIKMLVYKYLKKYEFALKSIDPDRRTDEVLERIYEVEDDLDLIGGMTDDEHFKGQKYYINLDDQNGADIVGFINGLHTWKRMRNESGVYREMSKDYKSIMDATSINQMIFQGPPGTSKTYGAKRFLAEQLAIDNDDWEEELKKYQLVNSIDGEYELPSSGQPLYWDLVQFHPSYSYEDFVRGITVFPQTDNRIVGELVGELVSYDIELEGANSLLYKTVNKSMGKIARIARASYEEAKENKDLSHCPNYYLIIDEINRANLATVFGELIYALEYRDKGVKTPYSVDGEDELVLPPNLYIIGTMNTADKSIGTIDYAIRRRFLFFKLLPNFNVVINSIKKYAPSEDVATSDEIRLFYLIKVLFDVSINAFDYEKEDVQVGHTYFIRKTSDLEMAKKQEKLRFLYQVVPILYEYRKDGVLDFGNVESNDSALADSLRLLVELLAANEEQKEKKYDELIEQLSLPDVEDEIRSFLETLSDEE